MEYKLRNEILVINTHIFTYYYVLNAYYNSHDKQKNKIERIKRNLSQEQLAELANLNRNTIEKIEREAVSPTIETVEKIAEAFNMTFLELVNIEKVEL